MITFTKSPITELVHDLSFAHYAARSGISQSFLKLFDYESGGAPYKAKFYSENPELCPPASVAMEDGNTYHAFVLQPESFDRLYSVITPSLEAELYAEAVAGVGPARTKSKAKGFSRSLSTYKAWEGEELAQGHKVITQEKANQLEWMRDALLTCDEVKEEGIFQDAALEVSAFSEWEAATSTSRLSEARLQLKGRFDIYPRSGKTDWIIDLKTARTAHPREFARQAWKLGYGIQAAFYLDLARANGRDAKRFGFLAQDKEAPYLACVHWLPEEWIRHGRIMYRKILLDVAEAIRTDRWPGYESGIIEPPEYAKTEMEAIAA